MIMNDKIELLREMFPKGSAVPVVLRHVSRSGMLRAISPLAADSSDVSRLVAPVLGRRVHKSGGVACHGAGMDMGFDLVYSLAQELYGDGYALRHRWI
jgi:hypothetical protein